MIPQSNNGAVLITSRSIDVAREMVGREQDIFRVGTMNESQASKLLTSKLRDPPDEDVRQLLSTLERFPLAITQAAAYINRQPRMSVSIYLDKLKAIEGKAALLGEDLRDMRRDEAATSSAFKTWQISFEQIRAERPSAANLLAFMSFCNQQGIPEFLLRRCQKVKQSTPTLPPTEIPPPREIPPPEAPPFSFRRLLKPRHRSDKTHGRISSKVAGTEATTGSRMNVRPVDHEDNGGEDDDAFGKDVALLHSFSLVATTTKVTDFEMHALVQTATRIWLRSRQEDKAFLVRFVAAMEVVYPPANFENWKTCASLHPHLQSISERRPSCADDAQPWIKVLRRAGNYARGQGLLQQAEELLVPCYAEAERWFGMDDTQTAAAADALGLVLRDQWRWEEAKMMLRQSVRGYTLRRGSQDLDTLISMSNLATVLEQQGHYDESETLHRQTLTGKTKVLGKDHPEILATVQNLAVTLGKQGKYVEAEALHRQALAVREERLGTSHPDTLTCLNVLGLLLADMGRYDEAKILFERAYEGRRALLGDGHLKTQLSRDELDKLLLKMAKEGKWKGLSSDGESREKQEGDNEVLPRPMPIPWRTKGCCSYWRNGEELTSRFDDSEYRTFKLQQ